MSLPWRVAPFALVLILGSACPGEEQPEVEDTPDEGGFAACFHRSSGATCGDLAAYQLEACDPASVAALDPKGIWSLQQRVELPDGGAAFGVVNLTLRGDGGTENVDRGWALSRREVDGGTFYVGYDARYSNGDSFVRSYAGCRSSGPDALEGCFVTCRAGVVQSQGTFRAKKVLTREEPAAQGLSLVFEAPVSQGTPVDVYVTKDHAYVVSVDGVRSRGGLTVFDVSNPDEAPRKVKELSGPADSGDSYWNGVWAKGDALYVGSATTGVRVYDISNPADPRFVRTLPGLEVLNVHTVFVRGDLLVAMDVRNDAVQLYDVAVDPLNPVLQTRYQAPGVAAEPGGYPHDSFVFEDRLYTFHWASGLQISDISDPSNPKHLGAYRYEHSTSHAGAVARFGDRLIAFEGGEDWGAHLQVLDVTNPAAVVKLGEWRMRPEVSIHNMVLDPDAKRLYIAHYQDGVRVLDVSAPELPVEVAHFNTWSPEQPLRGEDFYDGAIGIRRPVPPDVTQGGLLYVVDTTRGLLVLREQ